MAILKYDYVDPDNLTSYRLLKEGEGKFTVKNVFTTDKQGYPMLDKNGAMKLKLSLMVTDQDGSKSLVDDWLVGSYPSKIRDFALGVGIPGLYNASGVLDTDKLIGLGGNCVIKTETYNNKDSSKIAMYMVANHMAALSGKSEDIDDDIPF
jgi:hypothetical protein